jgi:hypothetical protein
MAAVKAKNGWENMSINQLDPDRGARSSAWPPSPTAGAPSSDPDAMAAAATLLRSPPVLAPPPPLVEKPAASARRASDLRGYAPMLLAHDPRVPHNEGGGSSISSSSHHPARGHSKNLSVADSMLFPGAGGGNRNRDSREQDAVQSLIFMSSPGNTAPKLRSVLPPLAPPPPVVPSSSYNPAATATTTTTTAASTPAPPARQPLPDSARRERKPLPTHKPNPTHRHSLSASMAAPRRIGFPASPGQPMDVDSPTPKPRRKLPTTAVSSAGASAATAAYAQHTLAPLAAPPLASDPSPPVRIVLPAALGAYPRAPRERLSEAEIERMIDCAMKELDDEDEDGPIEIPPRQRTKLPV